MNTSETEEKILSDLKRSYQRKIDDEIENFLNYDPSDGKLTGFFCILHLKQNNEFTKHNRRFKKHKK